MANPANRFPPGTATVQWTSGSDSNPVNNVCVFWTVGTRNARGRIWMSTWTSDGPDNYWNSREVAQIESDTDITVGTTLQAVMIGPNTTNPRVHLFYTVYGNSRSMIWNISNDTWTDDDGFNGMTLGQIGAATGWLDDEVNDTGVNLRLYYSTYKVGESKEYIAKIYEYMWREVDGYWTLGNNEKAIVDYTIASRDPRSFNNALAAISYKIELENISITKIRVFYMLIESATSVQFDGAKWRKDKRNLPAPLNQVERITAVAYPIPLSKNPAIRAYYLSPNVPPENGQKDRLTSFIYEYATDTNGHDWTYRQLPMSIESSEDRELGIQTSVVAYNSPVNTDNLILRYHRLHVQTGEEKYADIHEYRYDKTNNWHVTGTVD